MEYAIELGIGLVIAAVSLYLRHAHNMNVMARAQEILEHAADLGIGVAEEKGKREGIKGPQKEEVAIETTKQEALRLAEKHGKSVAKKVGEALMDKGGDLLKNVVLGRLGLRRIGGLF